MPQPLGGDAPPAATSAGRLSRPRHPALRVALLMSAHRATIGLRSSDNQGAAALFRRSGCGTPSFGLYPLAAAGDFSCGDAMTDSELPWGLYTDSYCPNLIIANEHPDRLE